MSISITCQSCGARFAGRDDLAGKKVRCPKCEGVIEVSAAVADEDELKIALDDTPESADSGVGEVLDEWHSGAGNADGSDEYKLAAEETDKCPTCGASMRPEAVLCVRCGYHRQKGVQMATVRDVPASPAPDKYSGPSGNPYASPTQSGYETQPQRFRESQESEPEWEGGGSVGAYLSTTLAVYTNPIHTFRHMVLSGNYGAPVSYALATYFVVTGVNFFYQIAFDVAMGGADSGTPAVGSLCCAAVCLPLLLLLWTCAVHGMLYVTGPMRGDFDTTFRVIAYCDGATRLLAMVPIVGVFLHQIAGVVYNIIGLIHAQQVSPLRAAAAVFAPLVLWIGLVVALVVFIVFGEGIPDQP